jgi:dienelactone hydrolase
MKTETLTYQADGLQMESQLFYKPTSSRQPGILVFPEVFGLGELALSHAERLAHLGYVALACDVHGNRRIISDRAEVLSTVGMLRAEISRTRARARAALDALRQRTEVDRDRIGAIGFCFGGTMALELARSGAKIEGVVGFHSGLATVAPQDACYITAKVLVCIGADDPGIPLEQRSSFEAEMRTGNVDWQMNVYGGVVHSFTNPDAGKAGRPAELRYDARAAARSWQQMLIFFAEIFSDH